MSQHEEKYLNLQELFAKTGDSLRTLEDKEMEVKHRRKVKDVKRIRTDSINYPFPLASLADRNHSTKHFRKSKKGDL